MVREESVSEVQTGWNEQRNACDLERLKGQGALSIARLIEDRSSERGPAPQPFSPASLTNSSC